MKKIGERTVMGQITSGNTSSERIILFDGRFDTGYVVKSFQIEFKDRTTSVTHAASATLYTEDTAIDNTNWDWGSNEQIAWSKVARDSDSIIHNEATSYVDANNLVVEDLYVGSYCQGDADAIINYKIVMEKYEITDSTGALAMVRNRSQS